MDLELLHQDLEAFQAKIDPTTPVDEIEAKVAEIRAILDSEHEQNAELKRQLGKENVLSKRIAKLQSRTRFVRDEAYELEKDDLSQQASDVYAEANDIHTKLKQLQDRVMQQRKEEFELLRRSTDEMEKRVNEVEKAFDEIQQELLRLEKAASIEDQYPPKLGGMLLSIRIGSFLTAKGLQETNSLVKRALYFERALKTMADLPEEVDTWATGLPDDVVLQLTSDAKALKEGGRSVLQEVHNLVSEGIIDKDIDGGEQSLPYSILERWRDARKNTGIDKNKFYLRLWALNLLLLKSPEQDTPLHRKVRSLLNFINKEDHLSLAEGKERQMADEGRRFVLMAGNGVIRRYLEQTFGGLTTEAHYAGLGYALYDRYDRYGLNVLKIAVNIPRKFDLALANRFEKLYEEQMVRTTTPVVTTRPVMSKTDDFDDIELVPPEELADEFNVVLLRFLQGDVTKVDFTTERYEQREVGQEKIVEAQIYILDVSESMQGGQRSVLRNAIWINALNQYAVDAAAKGTDEFPNVLGYREFGGHLTELFLVRNSQAAFRAFLKAMSYNCANQGDQLQRAILAGYDDVKNASSKDSSLGEAKVVLAVDGEAGLDVQRLLKAQNVKGTNVVTHYFAIENFNHDLKQLCDASGPGKAFSYHIKNAGDPDLAVKTPYGSKQEFSPVYHEPQFKTGAEQEKYFDTIEQMCIEIFEASDCAEKKRAEEEETSGDELESLMHPRYVANRNPYEMEADGQTINDSRMSKSVRVRDILTIMGNKTDEHTTTGEAMQMLRKICADRSVLFRDLKEVCERAEHDYTVRALKRYREDIYEPMSSKVSA